MIASRTSAAPQCLLPNFRPDEAAQTPFIPALPDGEVSAFVGALSSAETRVLRFIADNSDLLIVDGETWLLSPAPNGVIDVLAALDSATSDLEPGLEDEAEATEPECQDEGAQCDDEGSIETDYDAGIHS
jgi:hypothetical protein